MTTATVLHERTERIESEPGATYATVAAPSAPPDAVLLRTAPGAAGPLYTSDGLWRVGAETACLSCGQPVGPLAVYTDKLPTFRAQRAWHYPALHPRCAAALAAALGAALAAAPVEGEPV